MTERALAHITMGRFGRLGAVGVLVIVGCARPASTDVEGAYDPDRSPGPVAMSTEAAQVEPPPPASSVATPPPAPVAADQGLARGTGEPSDEALAAGDEAYDADDLASARQHYERAASLAPDDPAPQVGLARVRLAELDVPLDYKSSPGDQRLGALLERLDAVIGGSPKYGPAHLERGRVALILGDASFAMQSLERAVVLRPNDPEAHTALGVALLATGASDEALDHFRRASELDPHDPSRLTNLGTAYMMQGLVDSAVRAYERAARLAPNDPRVHGDLGTAYLAANRPDRAMKHLKRAVDLAPERATFLNNLGYAYQLGGNLELAVKTYRRALEKDEDLGSAWINLGTAQAQQGDYDAAEASFNEALAIDPSDPRAKANLEELAQLRKKGSDPTP